MQPHLYTDLASWWPMLSAKEDYAEEAACFTRALQDACRPRSVLELGCGGGSNAYHMKAQFALTLTDLSDRMLEVSRTINPECEHIQGDMRSLRLGRTFDAVFVHDAVMYMTSENDLRAAMATARAHLEPGGAALFVPDHVTETFTPSTSHGGHDAADGSGRGLRYLEWVREPGPTGCTCVVDFAYLLRDGEGVSVYHDRHELGLFPRETWLTLLRGAGLEPAVERDVYGRDLFVCRAM